MADTKCYLLKLPPELRLLIYNFAFHDVGGSIYVDRTPVYLHKNSGRQSHSSTSTALLRTNNEIYGEALPALYANTKFTLMLHIHDIVEDRHPRKAKTPPTFTIPLQHVKKLDTVAVCLTQDEDCGTAVAQMQRLRRQRQLVCGAEELQVNSILLVLGSHTPPTSSFSAVLRAIVDLAIKSQPEVVYVGPVDQLSSNEWHEFLEKVGARSVKVTELKGHRQDK